MKQNIIMETVDTTINKKSIRVLCEGEIKGATPAHITIPAGEEFSEKAEGKFYYIFILIEGSVVFETAGKEYAFDKRVTFVSSPEEAVTVKANTIAHLLEVKWETAAEDVALLEEYKTKFPVIQDYATSVQYIDPNKSEKTISRMMIPHKIIPRFSIGSVESYGYDLVRPHSHPMLDQFFFSFPENDMDVIINDEKIPMKGNIIMHIPLGADHGVEVTGCKHMHYMWIDFLPDNEEGLKRLDNSHKITGTMRDIEKEDKYRDVK